MSPGAFLRSVEMQQSLQVSYLKAITDMTFDKKHLGAPKSLLLEI